MSEVKNTSGILPTGRAILVQPYEPEKASSIIEMPDSVQDRLRTIEQRAVVIAIGPSAWFDEPHRRAEVGDKVLISAYSGHMCVGTNDKKQYRLVNDKDIFAKIEVESHE